MSTKLVSYKSNELSPEQKRNYKRSLVQSQESMWYLFESETQAGVRIMSPRDLFKSWEDFSERLANTERLELLHQLAFDSKPTAKELKDRVELSIKVWMKLCETAINRLDDDGAKGTGGASRTGTHKLADRAYEVVKTAVAATDKLPPQARTCLVFFTELMTAAKHDDAKGIFSIPEKDFNAYVVANAARLNTRQDPWRIFQYYRPTLIQSGFIRLV